MLPKYLYFESPISCPHYLLTCHKFNNTSLKPLHSIKLYHSCLLFVLLSFRLNPTLVKVNFTYFVPVPAYLNMAGKSNGTIQSDRVVSPHTHEQYPEKSCSTRLFTLSLSEITIAYLTLLSLNCEHFLPVSILTKYHINVIILQYQSFHF